MDHRYLLTHLQQLENESIQIIREVAAEFQRPVLLFSIGKDSMAMLRLAEKAFYPGRLPFPLLHVNTTYEFHQVIQFRDWIAQERGVEVIEWINQEGIKANINPIDHGHQRHTHVMKTEALKQALDHYGFDAALGGARRDEEKSRAKERVFSFRDRFYQWDPKNQRPELWRLYNTRLNGGESFRVFPLSNWTELDVWLYIHLEQIPVAPLYFAKRRPMVVRNGTLIMVEDERLPLTPGEIPEEQEVRFRTLGCYPSTGAILSQAHTVPAIIEEMLTTRTSERQGRVIDYDEGGSMEEKKREGYF
ncbi:MAG: sulfate adenylyltransferase subunit CysD [Candidatus Competibacterales bacterium]